MNSTESQVAQAAKMAERLALSFAADVTIPIFRETHSKKADQRGSGILFEARGRYFLITARHSVEGIDQSKIAIPRRRANEPMRTIGTVDVLYAEDSKFDAALLEFKKAETIDFLKESFRFVTPSNIGNVEPDAKTFLCGYPVAYMTQKGKTLKGKPLVVFAPLLDIADVKLPVGADAPILGAEFFCSYGRSGESPDGKVIEAPDLEGASGCGIWQFAVAPKGVWTSDSDIKLVGIQHSANPDRYFRAISWAIVHTYFVQKAPEIANDIYDAVWPGRRRQSSGDTTEPR